MTSARDAFFNKIYEMIEAGEDIYIVSADLGAPSLDALRKNYPQRFINVGIAEQGLISIAAGLAESGKKVVAYGLNPFPVTRAYDQLRCLLGELKIPLCVCALNAGLCSAEAGYTHMSTEVLGMLRMLPGIQVAMPSDELISVKLAESVVTNPRPRCIMFDKAVGGRIYNESAIDFGKGYASYHPLPGLSVGLVTNGAFVPQAREIADFLATSGRAVSVFDIYSLPIVEDSLLCELGQCANIVTWEENVLPGGLGSYVLELLADKNMQIPVNRHGVIFSEGVPRVFMSRDFVRSKYGLDKESLLAELQNLTGGMGGQA